MPIALRNMPLPEERWGQALSASAREGILRDVFGLELIPWQRDLFEAVGGPERPKVYYVSIARKSGKSYCLAAFILTELMLEPNSAIYIFSDSERNSKAVLFHELVSIVALCHDPTLFKVGFDKITYLPTGGFVMTRASNVQAVQGINPTLCCIDEVHLQRTDHVWNGAIMAGAARPQPMLLATTTPGYDITSLAHSLHEQVRAGELGGVIYEPPAGASAYQDREQWKLANPGLGYTFDMDNLEADFKLMPEHEFRRFRLGMWTTTAEAWLPYGAWAARTRPADYAPGEDLWLGFDGSYSGDSTALVGCNRMGHVKLLGLWEGHGKKGWRVPRDEVDERVIEVFGKYNVIEMHVDKPFWPGEVAEWDRRWPGKVIEFPTNSPARMAPACSSFYAGVVDGRITHDGDAAFARHVGNAVTRPTPVGDVIVKAAKDSPQKIDAAVAAVLAVHNAAIAAPGADVWVM